MTLIYFIGKLTLIDENTKTGTDVNLITTLYPFVGIIAVVGYYPQIRKLFRTQTSCQEISITTWSIWLLSWLISFLYAAMVIQDAKLSGIAFINIVGHSIIIMLALYKRKKYYNFSAPR